MKNYRIAEHPYHHAARCTWRVVSGMVESMWSEYVKPASIVAAGVAIGTPIAWIIGTALGVAWR